MILDRNTLAIVCKELRKTGKTIVFTNGCFDIIHPGHALYLADAKKLGDYLVVGINTDASVKRLKGPSRPINSESDRACVLGYLKPVDFVCYFEEDTPLELIKFVKPDVLVKGGDYSIDTIVGADFVFERGGKVLTIPLVQGKSTTNIINKMNDSN